MKEKDENPQPVIRTSKVFKRIQRTLNTAKYESITIEHGFEDEITWKDLSERNLKLENLNTLVCRDYRITQDKVLSELNLENKKAYFNTAGDKDNQPEPFGSTASQSSLDNLDTL